MRETAEAPWERAMRTLVAAARRMPGLRRVLLHPAVARPGYWLATLCGLVWGAALSRGRVRRRGGLLLAVGLPRWAFGRGGTTIGGVYLTHDAVTPAVLRHEAAHRRQWRRYGLAFIPLYLAAGQDPSRNRFEREAGLVDGGYLHSLHLRRGSQRPHRPDNEEY